MLKLDVDETVGKDRLQGQKPVRSGINWQAETVRQVRACSAGQSEKGVDIRGLVLHEANWHGGGKGLMTYRRKA